MKKRYLFPVLLLAASSALGQVPTTAKADKYFEAYNYTAAANAYEKVLKSEPGNASVMAKLVQCYQKLEKADKAEHWLEKALQTPVSDGKVYRELAALLATDKRYQEATQLYEKAVAANDSESIKWLQAYQNLNAFYEDSLLYNISRAPINSSFSDFSPAFYGNGVVFSSSRSNKAKANQQNKNYSSFIDLFFSENGAESSGFDESINSKYHEGPLSFNTTQDTVYFTRSNFYKKSVFSKAGANNLKIFTAVKQDGRWQNLQELPFNNDEYSVGHPALAGNNTLYFVSDMPGGFGGTDLYKVVKVAGTWQTPVNLGPDINTPGNEMFPFVDSNGNLYFASNGHPGLGGLDVFVAPKLESGFAAVKSLGHPINTPGDDFGLIVKDDAGYYSSNYKAKNDDIYAFKIDRQKQVVLLAVDNTGKPLTDVQLEASIAGVAGSKTNLAQAPSLLDWTYGAFDKLTFDKKGYTSAVLPLGKADFFKYNNGDTIRVTMPKKPVSIGDVSVQLALLDDAGNPITDGKIELTDINIGNKKNVLVKDGLATVKLSTLKNYTIVGSKLGFNNAVITLYSKQIKAIDSNEVLLLKLRAKELFNAQKVGETIELEIEYDLAKADIRPSAALILDKLVAYMHKYPQVRVELGAHTDVRGSNAYNQELSQRRAESAVAYVTSKGINAERMVQVGFGENKLKIANAKTETQHQANRRTTVKIIANGGIKVSTIQQSPTILNKVVTSKTQRYYIIIGGFGDLASAEAKSRALNAVGNTIKIVPPFAQYKVYRVSVADFARKEEAQKKMQQLKAKYGNDIWVLNY